MCGYKIQVLYLLPTTLHTFVSDTGTNINVFSTIPHCSAHFPSPLLSRFPSPLPPSSPPLAPPQSTAGPPSLRPVSVLFHLACCYRGLDAGRLQLGSQSFSIYQSPRLPPTHTHSLPPPFSLPHLSLYTHYPHQRQSRQHSNPSSHRCRTNLHTPLLPPTFHIFHFDQRRKFSSRDEKEKEVGEERNIVAVEAFKLERQLELYYYLGLCHW